MSDVGPPRSEGSPSGNPKVPIPRLLSPTFNVGSRSNPKGQSHSTGGRTKAVRVAHACERCKIRKIKCDGERPTCNHCREVTHTCRYIEKKRDTEKRRVHELESRVQVYEKLLRDVQSHLSHSGLQLAVEKALAGDTAFYTRLKGDQPLLSATDIPKNVSPPNSPAAGPSDQVGEPKALPTGSFELISQDINTFGVNNPFGYVGKCSCLWWIQRAREEMEKSIPLAVGIDTMVDPRVPAVEKLDATMYHLDDLGMPETDRDISPFTIPPKEVADVLVHDYFHTVHSTFPILSETIFMSQFEHLYENKLEPLQTGAKWLGIFNLVLAIGRSHCNLTENMAAGYENQADYFMRARILGALDGGILFQVPDLQQVQMLGLTAKYLLANHRINRAWMVNCLATCQAQGLGLHLDTDAPSLSTIIKNIRNCVWHALYSIETALVLVTGRVPLIREVHCSVPVPGMPKHDSLQLDDQGNVIPDPYLLAQRQLFGIINESIMVLYNTQNTFMSQADYQEHVAHLEVRMLEWKSHLPDEFSFDNMPPKETEEIVQREKRLDLAVRSYNTRMIIHRPFLCISESALESDSQQPGYSPLASARACIQSAHKLINIITSEDPHTMMKYGPWWCLVHFLSTAASVVVLELAFHSKHMPEEHQTLFELGDRIVQWFKGLQHVDMSSRRCYIVLEEMMRLLRLHNGTPMDVDQTALSQEPSKEEPSKEEPSQEEPSQEEPSRLQRTESLQTQIADMELDGGEH